MKRMATFKEDYLFLISAFIVALLFVSGFHFTMSYFEARAYNKITGSNVSTFDAMFVTLRAQACIK